MTSQAMTSRIRRTAGGHELKVVWWCSRRRRCRRQRCRRCGNRQRPRTTEERPLLPLALFYHRTLCRQRLGDRSSSVAPPAARRCRAESPEVAAAPTWRWVCPRRSPPSGGGVGKLGARPWARRRCRCRSSRAAEVWRPRRRAAAPGSARRLRLALAPRR